MSTTIATPPSALTDAAPAKRRRVLMHVLYWVVSCPVLLETAVGIQWDLARVPYVLDVLDRLGYPHYVATVLGITKILALVAILAPGFARLKEWAYAGLFFVYLMAAASHVAIGDTTGSIVTPLVLAGLTLLSWALRPAARRDPRPLPAVWRRLRVGGAGAAG
jgi:hypothetical protein